MALKVNTFLYTLMVLYIIFTGLGFGPMK